jgi:hypothetical protein
MLLDDMGGAQTSMLCCCACQFCVPWPSIKPPHVSTRLSGEPAVYVRILAVAARHLSRPCTHGPLPRPRPSHGILQPAAVH